MTPRAALALVAIVLCAGCGPSRAVKASMQEGQRAMAARAFRPALAHFRAAVAGAPDYAPAQFARGHAAETLGEFDEALEAYRAAAGLSAGHRITLATIAERMGQDALALQTLETAEGPWLRHSRGMGCRGCSASSCNCPGRSCTARRDCRCCRTPAR